MSENFDFFLSVSFDLCSILIYSSTHQCYVTFANDIVVREHTFIHSIIIIAFHILYLNSYNRIMQKLMHTLLPFINSISVRTHRAFGISSYFIFIYFCKCILPTLMHITLHNSVPVSLFCFVTV